MIAQTGEDVTVNLGGQLVEDFKQFDRLNVYHGNDWGNSLNLYGGCEKFPYAFNTRNFSKFKGEVFSLCIDFPDYHELLGKKLEQSKSRSLPLAEGFEDVDLDNMLDMQKRAKTLKYPNVTPKIVIGDSHSICMYRPGWMVNSVPYKTLHGALSMGLDEFIMDPYTDPTQVTDVEIYFGNIDIRHHLCRQPDRNLAVKEICNKYYETARGLYDRYPNLKSVGVYEPLPIENESRVIPTTGWYEKKPFFGSWAERNEIRNKFIDTMRQLCYDDKVKLIEWTSYLFNGVGELDLKKMEYKKSVHLSRAAYPYWTGIEYHEKIFEIQKARSAARAAKKREANSLESFF
jgi:hypothetical protein